ncbi:hypothetical protein DFQ27_003642 [Actinomortierella ambigua]|uniref:Thioredoxin domain-containing protein n=1 Tax=Actinomortierella ambigua TaxID=1343610 RepID=A0A9P6U581_9FUNG|nr:hypothetical protein DFQ27_003642 [Actinomortierella ambigua]
MPANIASTAELDTAVSSNRKVIVCFHAPWSPACTAIVPTFDGWEPDFPDLVFVKVNVDQMMPELRQKISSTFSSGSNKTGSSPSSSSSSHPDVPAFVAYRNGGEFSMVHGSNPDNLKELLEGLQGAADDDD